MTAYTTLQAVPIFMACALALPIAVMVFCVAQVVLSGLAKQTLLGRIHPGVHQCALASSSA